MARRRNSKRDHKKLIRQYEKSGSSQARNETLFVFEGPLSEAGDDILYHKEELQLRDRNDSPYQVSWAAIRSCDFGHVLGEQNRVVGRCSLCGAFLCAARGCTFSCRKCGRVCCRQHTVIYDDDPEQVEIYCTQHWWAHFVHRWFGL